MMAKGSQGRSPQEHVLIREMRRIGNTTPALVGSGTEEDLATVRPLNFALPSGSRNHKTLM